MNSNIVRYFELYFSSNPSDYILVNGIYFFNNMSNLERSIFILWDDLTFFLFLKAIGLHICESIIHLRNINLENWTPPSSTNIIFFNSPPWYSAGPTSWCKDSRINCNMGCILQVFNLNPPWHMGEVHWLSKSKSILKWVGEMSEGDRINGHIGCRYYHDSMSPIT